VDTLYPLYLGTLTLGYVVLELRLLAGSQVLLEVGHSKVSVHAVLPAMRLQQQQHKQQQIATEQQQQ